MPTYVYETIPPLDQNELAEFEPEQFEFLQRMSEDAFTHHPTTGVPIRRILCAPAIGTRAIGKGSFDKNAERNGFTKYVKNSDGSYGRAYGQGPENIRKQS